MVILFLTFYDNELVRYLRVNPLMFEMKPNGVTSIDWRKTMWDLKPETRSSCNATYFAPLYCFNLIKFVSWHTVSSKVTIDDLPIIIIINNNINNNNVSFMILRIVTNIAYKTNYDKWMLQNQ